MKYPNEREKYLIEECANSLKDKKHNVEALVNDLSVLIAKIKYLNQSERQPVTDNKGNGNKCLNHKYTEYTCIDSDLCKKFGCQRW